MRWVSGGRFFICFCISAIADTRKLIASDAPLQQDLRASLQELGRAAQALRHLADTLDRHPEALLRGKPEEKP